MRELSTTQADTVIKSISDLIDSPAYKPFFFKKLYVIGPALFVQLADHARTHGKTPAKLFVRLLNGVT